MTDKELRVGDTIDILTHSTLEGVRVIELNDYTVVVQDRDGVVMERDRDPALHTFRIVERANGATQDLIGTIRKHDGPGFLPVVKVDVNAWRVLGNGCSLDDRSAAEIPLVGTVEDSPAGKAAEAAKPKVFRAGDPEPDRSLSLTNRIGHVLKFGRHGRGGQGPASWWAVKNPVFKRATYSDWSYWAATYGPWTVLSESEAAESKAA